jgi:hypothetical protein
VLNKYRDQLEEADYKGLEKKGLLDSSSSSDEDDNIGMK